MTTSSHSGRSWVLMALSGFLALYATAISAPQTAGERRAAFSSSLSATGEYWQNIHGGVATGAWWNSLVDVTAHLDGNSVGAPQGSAFVAQAHWVMNRRSDAVFADETGAFNAVSGVMANDHVRVFNLHYRQTARDERWTFKVGQIAVDDDFMLSDHARLFANSAFGALPSQVATPVCTDAAVPSSFPIYGVAAPGAWLQVKLSPSTEWQLGLYHGGPGPDSKGNAGFAWTNARHSGMLTFTEMTWRYHALTSRVGAALHTGAVDDLRGQRTGERHRASGIHSVYTVQDIVLLRDVAERSKLGAFVRAGISPQADRSVVTVYGDAGVNWFAPFTSRRSDIAGSAISVTRFGADFRALNDTAATETTVELTYQARLSSRIVAQADVQFLFAPALQRQTGRRETATVVGIRTTIVF